MPQSMPDYSLTINYLDLMVELPWDRNTKGILHAHALSFTHSHVNTKKSNIVA